MSEKRRRLHQVFDSLPADCLGVIADFVRGSFFISLRLVSKHWNHVVFHRYEEACKSLLRSVKSLEWKNNPTMRNLTGIRLLFTPIINPWSHFRPGERWNDVNEGGHTIMFSIFPQFKLTYETYMEKKKYHRAFLCLSHEMCCKTCGNAVVPKNFRDLNAVKERYNTKEPHADIIKLKDDPGLRHDPPSEYSLYVMRSNQKRRKVSNCLCTKCEHRREFTSRSRTDCEARVFCKKCLLKHYHACYC